MTQVIFLNDDGTGVVAEFATKERAREYAEEEAKRLGAEVVEDRDGDFVVSRAEED